MNGSLSHPALKNKMKEAIKEYQEARVRLIKAIRKMNYRVKNSEDRLIHKYLIQKQVIIKELRKLDKVLREILEPKD